MYFEIQQMYFAGVFIYNFLGLMNVLKSELHLAADAPLAVLGQAFGIGKTAHVLYMKESEYVMKPDDGLDVGLVRHDRRLCRKGK